MQKFLPVKVTEEDTCEQESKASPVILQVKFSSTHKAGLTALV